MLKPNPPLLSHDWIMDHAHWLWRKPHFTLLVSMKTGEIVGSRLVDREANQFGVARGITRH